MSSGDVISVRYEAGCAQVRIGGRGLEVDRRDRDDRESTCPIELVSAALGS
jgi:hypothetical protein